MKAIYIIFLIFLSSFIIVQADETTSISFESAADGYTLSEDKGTVTIIDEGSYDLNGFLYNKKILVSSSCTLNLNEFSLTNIGALTPIIINEDVIVELVLTGDSYLIDSETNENDGAIYLQRGASLTISGTGTLNINPNKLMAINGTEGTSLAVNDGATIRITSDSSNVGGIYLRKTLIHLLT